MTFGWIMDLQYIPFSSRIGWNSYMICSSIMDRFRFSSCRVMVVMVSRVMSKNSPISSSSRSAFSRAIPAYSAFFSVLSSGLSFSRFRYPTTLVRGVFRS